MFAILVPATLLPLIVTLFWAERKAKRLGLVTDRFPEEGSPLTIVPCMSIIFHYCSICLSNLLSLK